MQGKKFSLVPCARVASNPLCPLPRPPLVDLETDQGGYRTSSVQERQSRSKYHHGKGAFNVPMQIVWRNFRLSQPKTKTLSDYAGGARITCNADFQVHVFASNEVTGSKMGYVAVGQGVPVPL